MNIFNIYLPVAGIHLDVLLLIAVGLCAGIGGGFIILPAPVYLIRLLSAIMMILARFSVMAEQFYKMTRRPFFDDSSRIVLVGAAAALKTTTIASLIIGIRKESAGRI